VRRELEEKGIWVFSAGVRTLSEEMPEAYKDVDDVVEAVTGAGLSRRVARLRPLGVVKG
jgi:tRNA-splicing ligase RtcB